MALDTEQAEGALRVARFRLSNILKTPDLRFISKDDISALVQLDAECFDDLYFEADEFQDEILIPSFYGVVVYNAPLIVTAEAQIVTTPSRRFAVAYIIGHNDDGSVKDAPRRIAKDDGKGGYLVSCAVHPKLQKRGIFSHLLNCFEDLSKMQGIGYLRLNTRTKENPDSNGDCIAFQKRGFNVTGTLDNYLDKGDHFYEMVKQL